VPQSPKQKECQEKFFKTSADNRLLPKTNVKKNFVCKKKSTINEH
jgi:hypothetical protein